MTKTIETKNNIAEESKVSSPTNFDSEIELDENEIESTQKPSKWRKRLVMLGVLFLIFSIVAYAFLRPKKAVEVTLLSPIERTITESIASSGRVGAATETNVGVQTSGIVAQIFVSEGDQVIKGQRLAVLKNDVAEAQLAQSRAALNRARAEFAETTRPALSSDIAASTDQISQAKAQLTQQKANVKQIEKTVGRQQAALRQRQAERDLSAKELERVTTLYQSGDYSRSQYDTAEKELRVAENRVAESQKAVEEAQAQLESARAGVASAEANVSVNESRLETTRTRSTPQQIEVARLRVAEAEQSLRVAEEQKDNADVIAPFAGTVTKINTEPGQSPGNQGVLSLVSTDAEIRLSVDESNLADLTLGQEAVISSGTFSNSTFKATVSEIAPAVDVERGTIEITLTPNNPPDWMRPGQTVNVNIITSQAASRLLIPQTALAKNGERNIVLVVENGKVIERNVAIKTPTAEGVPIISGLNASDQIISDVQTVKIGDEVSVK